MWQESISFAWYGGRNSACSLTLERHLQRKRFAHRPQDRTADMLQHPFELLTMPYRERLNYMRGRRVLAESTRLEQFKTLPRA